MAGRTLRSAAVVNLFRREVIGLTNTTVSQVHLPNAYRHQATVGRRILLDAQPRLPAKRFVCRAAVPPPAEKLTQRAKWVAIGATSWHGELGRFWRQIAKKVEEASSAGWLEKNGWSMLPSCAANAMDRHAGGRCCLGPFDETDLGADNAHADVLAPRAQLTGWSWYRAARYQYGRAPP